MLDQCALARKIAVGIFFSTACVAVPAYSCSNLLDTPLRGELTLSLQEAQSEFLIIRQHNEDLRVLVNSAEPYWLDSPGGRNVPEFVYMESPVEDAEIELCLYSAFDHSYLGSYEVDYPNVDLENEDMLRALRAINDAGRAWALGGASNINLAADIYSRAIETAPNDHELDYLLPLSAAMANIAATRLPVAKEILTELLASHEDHAFEYIARWQLAQVHRQSGNRDLALEEVSLGLDVLTRREAMLGRELRLDRADMLNLTGLIRTIDRDVDEGEALLLQALELAKPDYNLVGRIYNNLAFVTLQRTRTPGIEDADLDELLELSMEQHQIARQLLVDAKNYSVLLFVENNIAVLYDRMGEIRKGLVHYLNGFELLEKVDSPRGKNLIYNNLWNIYSSLGQHRRALSYLLEIVELNQSASPLSLATTHCRLGTSYRNIGETERAIAEHELCLQIMPQNQSADMRINALIELSRDFQTALNTDSALEPIRQAYELIGELENENIRPRLLTQYAKVLFENGELRTAAAHVAVAIDEVDVTRYPEDQIDALGVAMKLADSEGNFNQATELGWQAITAIEAMHTQLDAERQGPSWSHQTHSLFVHLAALYAQQYDKTGNDSYIFQAFDVLERSRAISLRQRLGHSLPSDVLRAEEDLQIELISRISSLMADEEIDIENDDSQFSNFQHQHNLLALSRLANMDELSIPTAAKLDEVRAYLKADQFVLDYLVTERSVYVFAINSSEVHFEELGEASALRDAVAEMDSVIRNPRSDIEGSAILNAISTMLLPEGVDWDAYNEVLIVPHSGLFNFPFAMLNLNAISDGSYVPLVSGQAIKILPSLSTVLMSKPASKPAYGIDVAVLADPVFNREQIVDGREGILEDPGIRSWSDELQPLPYTAAEADSLQRIFSDRSVEVYTGVRATRANLTSEAARNSKVLHIATHGYFKSVSDDNVGLALSVIDESGAVDPGFITLTELFAYSFNNELVVISGCDTAMGTEQEGVGMNSLTRGFLAQGANHVVSTLWPVSDRASALFMQHFYDHLRESQDVALALKNAQMELRSSSRYSSPFYWAPYVLQSTAESTEITI